MEAGCLSPERNGEGLAHYLCGCGSCLLCVYTADLSTSYRGNVATDKHCSSIYQVALFLAWH